MKSTDLRWEQGTLLVHQPTGVVVISDVKPKSELSIQKATVVFDPTGKDGGGLGNCEWRLIGASNYKRYKGMVIIEQ